jgi:hypothetical protein
MYIYSYAGVFIFVFKYCVFVTYSFDLYLKELEIVLLEDP